VSDAPLAFVIDPVDGTKNFASGLPLFGVMAAILEHGETVAGVILDPIVDDWAFAVRGRGAWLENAQGASRRLRVAPAEEVAAMTGFASWLFMREPLRSTVTRNLARLGAAVDYRTAAHEYRLLATGAYQFALFGKLAPWDHLAGVLLVEEAGGCAACLDGSAYGLGARADGLLCAPDERSWRALRDVLLDDTR
jgi:fructose-1,6-bisphosphatase/inositol monophosphatase family enzyme